MSDQDIKVGQKYFYKGYSQEYIFEILSFDPYELKYLCTEPGKSDTKEIVVSTFDFKNWIKRGHLALINKAKEKPAVYFREEKFTYQTNRSVPEEMMNKIITAYNIFYILGTLLAMQIPFVQFLALTSSEHMASHGVFIIVQVYGLIRFAKKFVPQ